MVEGEISFGRFRLDLARRELRRDEAPVRHCHGNSIEHALRAKTRHASCRCDGILPVCGSFGSEDPQCGSGR